MSLGLVLPLLIGVAGIAYGLGERAARKSSERILAASPARTEPGDPTNA